MKDVPLTYDRSDLVLPLEVWRQLDEFIRLVRHHDAVTEHFGGSHAGKGCSRQSALFWGPPGTGKSMVAQVVARELGLTLRRVDLSTIVSKYLGETEKNLNRVFDAAAAEDCILLFDEADALFGKRTDVKDSVDRYAAIHGCRAPPAENRGSPRAPDPLLEPEAEHRPSFRTAAQIRDPLPMAERRGTSKALAANAATGSPGLVRWSPRRTCSTVPGVRSRDPKGRRHGSRARSGDERSGFRNPH
jgi:SpoVK/Ycf46/Vps4 family AAA+-type ATPase